MAVTATSVGECRAGLGAAQGSGFYDPTVTAPGIDYSQQNSPQRSWLASGGTFTNDLVVTNATNSVVTSASYSFTSNDPGNSIYLSAGTNLTAGRYTILSVSGGAATIKGNATTGADATGCSGYEGGAFDSIMSWCTQIQPGNTMWQKYTGTTDQITSQITITNGTTALPIVIRGYSSTRGDLDDPASGGTYAATHGSNGFINVNLPAFTHVSSARLNIGSYTFMNALSFSASSVFYLAITNGAVGTYRCKFNNTGSGNAIVFNAVNAYAEDCEFTAASADVVGLPGGTFAIAAIVGCRITAGTGNAIATTGGNIIIEDNVFYNIGSTKAAINQPNDGRGVYARNNTMINSSGSFILLPSSPTGWNVIACNNQITGNGNFIKNPTASNVTVYARSNRLRNNTANYTNVVNCGGGDITTAQTDAVEYVAPSASPADVHLLSAAAGASGGVVYPASTGAYQYIPTGSGGGVPTINSTPLIRRK